MARIDKTYTNNYDDYRLLLEWSKDKIVNFNYNHRKLSIPVKNFIYEWDKDSFNSRELPVMNTPTWLDKYLIDNCTIDFVLDRLNEVYGDGYLDDISLNTIPGDYKKNRKVSIVDDYDTSFKLHNNPYYSEEKWWIQSYGTRLNYSDNLKAWVDSERFPSNSNTMFASTIKSTVRLLRGMYLPKTEFKLIGRCIGEVYKIKVK